jgi:Bifunctional DNA primase/polymerase, N-terminal
MASRIHWLKPSTVNDFPYIVVRIETWSRFAWLNADPRNGGRKTLKKLQAKAGKLPMTVTARTGGGGLHVLFRHPGFPVRSRQLGPGLEIKSDGSFIVAPRSRHASGKKYEPLEISKPNGPRPN